MQKKSKVCPACGKRKRAAAFGERRRGGKVYLNYKCKPCFASYMRDYRKDPQKLAKHAALVTARQKGLKEFVRGKKDGACTDCGKRFHYWQMQFDHRPGEHKVACVSWLVCRGFSRERLMEEIQKCDLVCANCHAHRTYRRIAPRDATVTQDDIAL